MFGLWAPLPALFLLHVGTASSSTPVDLTLKVAMRVDVDGAPNAYGPPGKPTLDNEENAHDKETGKIVGYLTHHDDGRTPVIQRADDPCPGYYISTTGYTDIKNKSERDPRKYVNAAKINYVVLSKVAKLYGTELGDFVAVYSRKYNKSVYAIIGDTGNISGAEGSLALINALGYHVIDGRSGDTDPGDITIRYFPHSNPLKHFFAEQKDLDAEAATLHLSKSF